MSRIENISMKLNDSNCVPKINRIKIINEIALLNISQNKRLIQQPTYKHRD